MACAVRDGGADCLRADLDTDSDCVGTPAFPAGVAGDRGVFERKGE